MSGWDDAIEKELARDPIADADKLVRKAQEDGVKFLDAQHDANLLGLMFHLDKSKALEGMLAITEDTVFSMNVKDYIKIIQKEGFRELLRIPFESHHKHKNGTRQKESLFIFWHDETGILLKFDTFGRYDEKEGTGVNGGNFYYNWSPIRDDSGAMVKGACRAISSGTSTDSGIWYGDHDCREALRFNIRRLKNFGKFVTPWVKRPFMWLCHHMDHHDENGQNKVFDYEAINQERISMLPKDVQEKISPA
jgi:hypothetical protein